MNDLPAESSWRVQVFFDGKCPLCRREINLLSWLDWRRRILFTDISEPSFSAGNYNKSQQVFMDEIQGRLPDGQWIQGVEVFRQLYAAVGFSLLVPLTRLPIISHSLEFGYRVFAKNRLRLTGRCVGETCDASG